jgi:hypothetical protein
VTFPRPIASADHAVRVLLPRVKACRLAESLSDSSVTKAPAVWLPPRFASIATGWSDPVTGQDCHLLQSNTFQTAHAMFFPLEIAVAPAPRACHVWGPACGLPVLDMSCCVRTFSARPVRDQPFTTLSEARGLCRESGVSVIIRVEVTTRGGPEPARALTTDLGGKRVFERQD